EQIRFLEEVRAHLTPEQLQAPANPDIMQKLRGCLKFSPQDTLQGIRDLNDAYHYAHDLEHSEINAVLEFIINEYHLDLALRARLVDHYLQTHVKRLLALGGVAWRQSIQARRKFLSSPPGISPRGKPPPPLLSLPRCGIMLCKEVGYSNATLTPLYRKSNTLGVK
ncbi:MAG: hypothetical protein N2556_06780, partial [Anaerolineae bacterium]|nr:hypothetical protein [Anaerolineae bacterium]